MFETRVIAISCENWVYRLVCGYCIIIKKMLHFVIDASMFGICFRVYCLMSVKEGFYFVVYGNKLFVLITSERISINFRIFFFHLIWLKPGVYKWPKTNSTIWWTFSEVPQFFSLWIIRIWISPFRYEVFVLVLTYDRICGFHILCTHLIMLLVYL